MRFLVDECTGATVARWLRRQGHEVFSVYEEARGMEDDDIIQGIFQNRRKDIERSADISVEKG